MYYGDYKIDEIYDVNDFLANTDLDFYKIRQATTKGKKSFFTDRYIILTDVYFLLFDPVPGNRHLAKLLFWGDIRQLSSSKGSSEVSNSLILEWKNNDKIMVSFELLFGSISIKEFLEISSRRINKLRERFKVFHDEFTKPNVEDKGLFQSLEKLVLLVQLKEELLQSNYSIHTIRELMSLYQRIIEILSEKNDPEFRVYLNKLHSMLENQEIQRMLDEKLTEKKVFELSNSYYSTPHED